MLNIVNELNRKIADEAYVTDNIVNVLLVKAAVADLSLIRVTGALTCHLII